MGNRFIEKFRQVFDSKEKISETVKAEFEFERTKYEMPEPEKYDLYDLDPLSKRKMTICNLFANHQKTIPEISGLLDVSRKLIIHTLIENKLLKDRRRTARQYTPELEIK